MEYFSTKTLYISLCSKQVDGTLSGKRKLSPVNTKDVNSTLLYIYVAGMHHAMPHAIATHVYRYKLNVK